MRVRSSWIESITSTDRGIVMNLGPRGNYLVVGANEEVADAWRNSKSKGQFFHKLIKRAFHIKKI